MSDTKFNNLRVYRAVMVLAQTKFGTVNEVDSFLEAAATLIPEMTREQLLDMEFENLIVILKERADNVGRAFQQEMESMERFNSLREMLE